MFGIGTTEFLVIIVVAILVLGPEHLPRIMRTFTKVMSDFRRVSTDFQRTINLEANQEEWQREQAAMASKKKKKKKKPVPPAENDATEATREQDGPADGLAAEKPSAPHPDAPSLAKKSDTPKVSPESPASGEARKNADSAKKDVSGTADAAKASSQGPDLPIQGGRA